MTISQIESDVTINGDLRVNGTLRLSESGSTGVERADMVQETLTPFDLPPETWRIHDNMDALLADPAVGGTGNDDLGIVSGTYGSGVPYISTGDNNGDGALTKYARRMVQLPYQYVAGETVVIRLRAGMKTTVADVSATVDVQAFKSDNEGAVSGSDLCATAATTCNSLTPANKDFTITATSLNPGDWLDVRIAIATNDAATVGAVIGFIGRIELLCDTKG